MKVFNKHTRAEEAINAAKKAFEIIKNILKKNLK